jgi:hypothetical protein
MPKRNLFKLSLAAALATGACGGSGIGGSTSGVPGGAAGGFAGGTGGSTGAGGPSIPGAGAGGAGTGGMALPPETELESSYEVPVATGRFVWIANPTSGRVAYVDAQTLQVRTVEAGNAPTFMAAIPSATDDAVIVLNALSDDATILRAKSDGLTSQTVRGLTHGGNAWSVSSDGQWAVAWTDARQVKGATKTQGFQDIAIINIKAATKAVVAVGFRPAAVAFSSDGKRAFAVTQDGISIVDLTAAAGPTVSSNIALSDDPTADADTRDVSITPNGRLAVTRREGSQVLGIVDLGTGTRTALDLGGAITDVDLTAAGDRAVAVLRDQAQVVLVPLAAGAPTIDAVTRVDMPGQTVGSVALTADGKNAVLYSNASDAERLVVLSLGPTPSFRAIKLHGAVLSAFPTPDGANAVVLHREVPVPAPAPAGPDGGVAADAGSVAPAPLPAAAFSLVPLDGMRPARLQDTGTPPRAVAIAPASNRALVTVSDDRNGSYAVFLGAFPSLEVTRLPLASPPISVGVVAGASRGFVAQKHPEGRITFVGLDSGDARTLTGFELGARVVDWSQP